MKAAIVLLANNQIQNYIRRVVYELNTRYAIDFFASTLPSHVSLKQPFAFESMDLLENYFDGLASQTAPVEMRLDRLYYEEWSGYGILGLSVVETPVLRALHNRLNEELSRLFQDTRAPHDGSGYHFHMTIELGQVEQVNGFREYFEGLKEKGVNFTFTARELALFYYTADANRPGSFITYRVQPLTGSR